jgi:hypothetical protein
MDAHASLQHADAGVQQDRLRPAAMLTARVSCQDSTKVGPALSSSFWRAKASQTGDHSEPGDDMM